MEQISWELGKQLFEQHFKIGHWYCFPKGENQCKYMKVESIIYKANVSTRAFLRGTGFIILHSALHTPKIRKDEPFVYCWAKDYIKEMVEISENNVKEIFKAAAKKSYFNIFTDE